MDMDTELQNYIDVATLILKRRNIEDCLFLDAHNNCVYGKTAIIKFFKTTNSHVKMFQVWITHQASWHLLNNMFDEKTNMSYNFDIYKSKYPLKRCYVCFSCDAFKKYENFILNHTKHRLSTCKKDENYSFFANGVRYFCAFCGVPFEIEFEPNLNKKSIEIWSLWSLAESYIEWIPEEVLIDVLILVCI
jgi:hypothetical protein